MMREEGSCYIILIMQYLFHGVGEHLTYTTANRRGTSRTYTKDLESA